MMGWLLFLVLALLVLAPMLWPARIGRAGAMLVGSALFVAAAGYAWQGSPGLPGAPTDAGRTQQRSDSLFAAERQRFLNKYGETGQVLATADAFDRLGLEEAAAGLLANAVAKHPADVDLRIGYAHALFVQAGGVMAPAVQLAFDRAAAIGSASPAPRYFLGLTRLESGDPLGAEQVWRQLYAGLAPDSDWRKPLAQRLTMFNMMRAAQAARTAPASAAR